MQNHHEIYYQKNKEKFKNKPTFVNVSNTCKQNIPFKSSMNPWKYKTRLHQTNSLLLLDLVWYIYLSFFFFWIQKNQSSFFFCSIPCFGFGQNQIRGKIVDELGFPIYRASIQLHATDSVVYTDFDGSFSLISEKDFHWKINIQSQGYQTETFFVLEGGSTGAIVLEYDMDMKAILEENGSDHE